MQRSNRGDDGVAIWEQWGVPLAVLALVLATLFMAGVVKRYQAHQALIRARVRRVEVGITLIEDALGALRSVPLSHPLRVMLRGDVLSGYQAIARLYRSYPGIGDRIRAAEQALQGEGAPLATGVGAIDDAAQLGRVTQSIDALVQLITDGDTVKPVPADVRAIFCRELGERRAEANARFHLTRSRQCSLKGDLQHARAHITTLMQILKRRGPGTEFVRDLYAEAEQALSRVGEKVDVEPAADAASENAA